MKVLLLSASIGMGHVHAADAIEKALNGKVDAVRHEDALDFAIPAFRNFYRKAYSDLVANAPELLGLAYDFADKDWEKFHYGVIFERLNIQKLADMVRAYKPDVVISTHSLPADMISSLLCKRQTACRHAIVITDFDVHPAWLCHHYSRYFVAIEETQEHMVSLGFDRKRISVTGIPIDPVYAMTKDKWQMREKFQLEQDRTTILISAGGFGMGPVEEILTQLAKLPGKNQVITVCGTNPSLKKKCEFLARTVSTQQTKIHVLGFTTVMDELMSASDLIIGKPGGLTSSQALAKGLVFVIVSPIPGQEERNADHLLEEGVAIRCNNLPALSYKVRHLLSDPARLKRMQESALLLARPNSAQQIASQAVALIQSAKAREMPPSTHVCGSKLSVI